MSPPVVKKLVVPDRGEPLTIRAVQKDDGIIYKPKYQNIRFEILRLVGLAVWPIFVTARSFLPPRINLKFVRRMSGHRWYGVSLGNSFCISANFEAFMDRLVSVRKGCRL